MGSEADHTLLTHQRVPLAGRSYGLCGEGRRPESGPEGRSGGRRSFGDGWHRNEILVEIFLGGAVSVFCLKKVT